MAEKRMFAKTIIDSDAFLDLSSSARLLYYDLGMRADDDGVVNSPKKIMRMTGASDKDMTQLFESKFVIPFETGIVIIKHWKVNNYLRKDRYRPSPYTKELQRLVTDDNGVYRLSSGIPDGIPDGIPEVDSGLTQYSIDKNSIDKNIEQKLLINNFFETIWKAYPNKKGKNKISDTQKRKLYQLGEEVLLKCIERYNADKPDWQDYQHGSSFFNKGYFDYLDENYTTLVNDRYKDVKGLI